MATDKLLDDIKRLQRQLSGSKDQSRKFLQSEIDVVKRKSAKRKVADAYEKLHRMKLSNSEYKRLTTRQLQSSLDNIARVANEDRAFSKGGSTKEKKYQPRKVYKLTASERAVRDARRKQMIAREQAQLKKSSPRKSVYDAPKSTKALNADFKKAYPSFSDKQISRMSRSTKSGQLRGIAISKAEDKTWSNRQKSKSKPKPQAKKIASKSIDPMKALEQRFERDRLATQKAENSAYAKAKAKTKALEKADKHFERQMDRTNKGRLKSAKALGFKPKSSWLSRQFNSAYKSVSGAGSSAYKSIFGAPQAAKSALKYAAKNPLAVAKAGGKFGAGAGGAIAAYSVGEALGRSAGRAVGDALGGGKVGDFSEKVGSLSGGTVGTTASLGVGSSLAARRAAKKAGKKLGAKAAAKIALKVGARAIPVVGQGVMVFDAVLATGEAIQEVQQMRKQGIEYQNSWYQEKNRALRGGDLQQAFQAMSSDDKAKFQTLKNKDDRFAMLERSHSTNVASNQEQRRIARGGEPQKADKQIVGKSASDVKSKVAKVNGNRRGAVKLKAPDKPKRKAVVKAKTQTQKRKPAAKKEVARFQTMANGKMSEKKWTDRGWANRKAAAKKRRKS